MLYMQQIFFDRMNIMETNSKTIKYMLMMGFKNLFPIILRIVLTILKALKYMEFDSNKMLGKQPKQLQESGYHLFYYKTKKG